MHRVAPRRTGLSSQPVLAALALLVVVPAVVGSLLARVSLVDSAQEPLTCVASRGMFIHEVRARGEVESAINVDVCCEVSSRDFWLTILDVVPDGTWVKPGDFLVRFDSKSLDDQLHQQKLQCDESAAWLASARAWYELARDEKRNYLEADYPLARQQAEQAVFAAEEKFRRAERFLAHSRRLDAQGYVTRAQLDADRFALEAARVDLEGARLKLRILENYTRPLKLGKIDSLLAMNEARIKSAEFWHQANLKWLAKTEEQLARCVVRSPAAGQVTLAHLRHENHNHMIEPGEKVFRNQVLVRLPDPRHMQVKSKIAEDQIAYVLKGLPVTIGFDAFPGVTLPGEVVRVNEYPAPEDHHGPNVKQYETIVRIDGTLPTLRPGLAADLRICVRRLENQLQVPCQAILARGDKNYCVCKTDGKWQPREVSLGATNGIRTVISAGLEAGEKVAFVTDKLRDDLELPELSPGFDPAHSTSAW